MKRSEINTLMRNSLSFLKQMHFLLPPFATWTPEEWKTKGPECFEIIDAQLGWDITDFGKGDYYKCGLFMFTIRNGTMKELEKKQGKVYAEKILIVEEAQITPTHFHYQKMEDIINRGGGNLVIQLWNSDEEEGLSRDDVFIRLDGVKTRVPAGGIVTLKPGESICLPQKLYHKFWGEEGKETVLVGEVSRVNDDFVDNRFFDPMGRFPDIEEDEVPLHLLYTDYKTYYTYYDRSARS